jgi:uncharacterized membrane protein
VQVVKSVATGLLVALVLFLFVNEPLVAVSIGLLALVGHLRISTLEQRLGALEVPARRPARRPAHAHAPSPARTPAPPPLPAFEAPTHQPVDEGPDWTAGAQRTWDRWRGASLGEIEELVAGRLLAVVGGIALFLGAVFFLGLAFSRGWIGPELRIAVGLVIGVVLFGLGGWLLRGQRQIVAHVLVAVGIGVFTLAMFAATRLYGFVGPEFGVAAALVAAAAAAALAVRFEAPTVAAFGLVAVLASPPIMGASATLLTLAFIGTALAGTTAIAVLRSWRWLPPLAFLLAAPQLTSYVLGDPPVGIALAAVGGFWLLNAISAAGEELHRRQYHLSPTSATVLLATAAFTLAAGFEILSGELEPWRGLYLLTVAAAHLALASVFLLRESDRHPFGMLVAGTGIAAVTMAVPIQLGAEWVPLAWAAEAVALAWIYVERQHRYSGLVAFVLGTMAAGHILAIEYPPDTFALPLADATPFVNPNGMALGFVVLAAGVAIWLLRARHERIAVAAVAATLVAVAVPHELRGWAEAVVLSSLVAGLVVVARRLLDVPLTLPAAADAVTVRLASERALYGAAAVATLFLAATFFDALPFVAFADGLATSTLPSGIPLTNEPAVVALMTVAGALAVALACDGRWRSAGLLTAAGFLAYLLPFEVGAALAVVGWAVLAIGLAAGASALGPLAWGARTLAVVAAAETLGVVAPIERLWVRTIAPDELAVLNGAVLAAVAIAVMLAARASMPPVDRERRWTGYAAAAVAVYAASIAMVDVFQVQVGGGLAVEELQKQAQVALSVLWAVIGSVVTVIGLRVHRAPMRLAGLALLGVVTMKVFVVDLAALDIAYRVLSFAALGVLLLAAAFLYGRMQPPPARSGAGRPRPSS